MHGPAYGAQKAGLDKMAADMAVDFAGTVVSTISIWMGVLLTERMRRAFDGRPDALAAFAAHAETPEFTGRLIDGLYRDPDLPALSGHTVIGAELAARYGITDDGGRRPPSHREALGAPPGAEHGGRAIGATVRGSVAHPAGSVGSVVVAIVDSSAHRTGRRVHDVIADARPLLLAEGLLQRIHLLLTLARWSGQDHSKPEPQLLLQLRDRH